LPGLCASAIDRAEEVKGRTFISERAAGRCKEARLMAENCNGAFCVFWRFERVAGLCFV